MSPPVTSFKIENSVAFVTGTNKKNGIGRAIVEALLAAGAAKIYATARKISQLDDLVQEYPDKVVPVGLDVTDLDAIQALPAKFPDVNLVVNNAGYAYMTEEKAPTLSSAALEKAQTELAVNYIAPMAIVKSFAPQLSKATSSAVVNINSIASLVNFPIAATYSASKAAAHSLTQAQRRDLPDSLVVGVYPGPIDTAMADDLPEGMEKESPSVVAKGLVDALRNGTEDVFPDTMAAQLYEGWKADAKAVERMMAKPQHTTETTTETTETASEQ